MKIRVTYSKYIALGEVKAVKAFAKEQKPELENIVRETIAQLKKIIRSAPVADEVEKLRKERDAAVADIQGVMRNAADTCYRCKHRFGDSAAECCIDCEDGSNWEWRGVVDE